MTDKRKLLTVTKYQARMTTCLEYTYSNSDSLTFLLKDTKPRARCFKFGQICTIFCKHY